jgi:hypothetical protein
MIYVKIILLLAVVAAAIAGVLAYNSAIANAERLEGENRTLTTERDGWIDAAARENTARVEADRTSSVRENQRRRLEQERNDARAKLAEVRKDPESASWLDQRIPLAVVARLRDDGLEAPAQTPDDRVPKPPATTHISPPVQWDPERRPAQLPGRSQDRAPTIQR